MKEFIEIPFGAKDSELCGWEYTIPEGFVASIENGKIIVKKEEGEDEKDEKIRKALIEYFNEQCDMSDWNGVYGYQVVAWLEKQCQTFTKKDVDDAYLEGVCAAKSELEKQGEQKPAEWTADDEEELKIALNTLEEAGQYSSAKWLKNVCLVSQTMQKHAWSEEDEKMYRRIYDLAAYANYDVNENVLMRNEKELSEYTKITNWLKSLKDRVQPKQEWSEVDEEEFQIAIDTLVEAGQRDSARWLKSLKDRYTWKPSDEQFKMLENVRKILHTNKDIYSKANNLMFNFEELIRTLKKLKE